MKKLSFSGSKTARLASGKGFYIALCVCVAAVAVAGYFAYTRTLDKLGEDNNLGIEAPVTSAPNEWGFADEPTDQVNKAGDETVPVPVVTVPADTAAPANKPFAGSRPFLIPVSGEILQAFSGGELVKSTTLDVWKTHDGVDIKAELGAPVKAMTTGTVQKSYDDPRWGVCIIIDHGDGIEGHYYNLAPTVNVTVGQEVEAGTVIGSIGKSAAVEVNMEDHLHFGVKKGGSWIDPLSLIPSAQ